MTGLSVRDRRMQALERCCYEGLSAAELRVEVLQRLRTIMTVDAAFFASVDPSTLLFTAAIQEDPLGDAGFAFLDNEFGQDDVNKFAHLATATDPAASLDGATAGNRSASVRYREILAPLGLGDELRTVLRTNGTAWGVMCLHREDGPHGFDAREALMIAKVGPHIAAGLRHAVMMDAVTTEADSAPGVILLERDLRLVALTPAAEALLAEIPEIDWPRDRELPIPVYAVAARLNSFDPDATSNAAPHLTLRGSRGRWLTLHASRLSRGTGGMAIVIESAAAVDTVPVILLGYGLTKREAVIAQLVIRGSSTQQIVNELRISAYTVQDHLTAIFDKLGVRSRRELVTQLLTHGGQTRRAP